jgi:Undecaprenyl-phosphate glucose phosphotransferase
MASTAAARVIDKLEMKSPASTSQRVSPVARTSNRRRVSPESLHLFLDALRFIDGITLTLTTFYIYIVAASILPFDLWMSYFPDILCGAVAIPLLLHLYGLYHLRTVQSASDMLKAAICVYGLGGLIVVLSCALTGTLNHSFLLWAGLWLSSSFLVFLVTRLPVAWGIAALMRRGIIRDAVAIVGGGPLADRLIDHLSTLHLWQKGRCPIEIVGIFDDRHDRLPPGCLTIAGTTDDLITVGREGGVDRVLVTLPWTAEQRLAKIRDKLQALAIDVLLCPAGVAFPAASSQCTSLNELPFYTLAERPLRPWSVIVKRGEDLLLGSLALVLLAPLMAFVALAVKLDSPGPVLFQQRRHGFNNREIDVYKFRTMRVDMADASGGMQARRGDARITRLGSVLRRTSLDELPQLLNVLKGDMSLVGPRPHPIGMRTQDRLCHEIIENYVHRHRVKPGITGWAQVNGYRGATRDADHLVKRVEFDLFYIQNWSLLFDIKIMLKTVSSLITTENAF